MVADQRLECAGRAGQDGRDQHAIGVDGLRLARTHPAGFDDRLLPWTHPVIDTPREVRLQPCRSAPVQPAADRPYLLSRPGPYRPG